MKKFTTILITLIITCVTALELGGCKEKIVRPEFTAESPCYGNADLLQNTLYKEFFFDTLPYGLDPYDEFVKYYKTEFKQVSDKDFYVLNLGEPVDDPALDRQRYCNVYGQLNTDNELENLFLFEGVEIYDESVGGWLDNVDEIKPGYHNWTIYLSIVCVPVENELIGEFTLEFGRLKEKDGICDSFINIYCQSICIATCEYREGVDIPLSWYENFFKTNLIYGGNL